MKALICTLLLVLLPLEVIAATHNFCWKRPDKRENGVPLAAHEIAGYEMRGYSEAQKKFIYYPIKVPAATSYMLVVPDQVQITYFEIAVYDVNGVYSRFVVIDKDPVGYAKCMAPTKPSKPMNLRIVK